MTPSPNPTTSPRTRQQFSEPGAYSAAENSVLEVVRHENAEITSYLHLGELAGLSVADAEKTARRLVNRGCIKIIPIYADIPHSPLEFKAVQGWDNPDLRPGTLLSGR